MWACINVLYENENGFIVKTEKYGLSIISLFVLYILLQKIVSLET